MKYARPDTQNGPGKRALSAAAVAANPALYRAYRTLELALHSGSDHDLVRALNIYIDTAQKQHFLVDTATILRNALSIKITAEEKELSKRARDTATPIQASTDHATSPIDAQF